MRVFVTGGNGFVGSTVVRDLVTAGHHVVCLLRRTSHTERIDDLCIERVYGDVCDLPSMRAAIAECDGTIHLAAPGGWVGDNPAVLHRVIVDGTRNALQAAAEFAGHRIVIVSSTAAINGSEQPRIFDERAPYTLRDPQLTYAHAKHHAELLARDAAERGVATVVVNPAEVYGPHDTNLGTAGNLIDFATSRPVLVCRGGTAIVHVADVSAGIIRALTHGRPGQRYILAGQNLTIRELAQLVLQLLGRRVPIVMIPRMVARAASRIAAGVGIPLPYNPHVVPYATRYWFVDSTKAQRELGVSFRGARETISSALDWLRQRKLL
jgi:dihydroflavonol-4-reductase